MGPLDGDSCHDPCPETHPDPTSEAGRHFRTRRPHRTRIPLFTRPPDIVTTRPAGSGAPSPPRIHVPGWTEVLCHTSVLASLAGTQDPCPRPHGTTLISPVRSSSSVARISRRHPCHLVLYLTLIHLRSLFRPSLVLELLTRFRPAFLPSRLPFR